MNQIKLLADVLKSHAPKTMNEREVDAIISHFTSKADTTYAEMELSLVSSIYDGLAYGNWPWVLAKLKENK